MGKTILLADKSVTIQKIVQLTFADEDFEITCVSDGQSALEAISRIHPSIILADISLPGLNGYELCTAVRKDPTATSATPVILLAGIYETMDEDRARQAEERVKEVGANSLLSKPFDPQVLTAKVKELLAASSPTVTPAKGMFAEALSEDTLTVHGGLEKLSAPKPADDTEKTMMLPGPPSFGVNMFAESEPVEESEPPVRRVELDIDKIKPTGEIVFDEQELQAMGEESEQNLEPVDEKHGIEFPGFDRPFTMDTEDVPDTISMKPEQPKAAAPAPPPAPVHEPTPSPQAVFGAEHEDPFADVFGESTATPSWSAGATSEEAPFGMPEPPAPPPAPVAPPEPEIVIPQAPEPEAVFDEMDNTSPGLSEIPSPIPEPEPEPEPQRVAMITPHTPPSSIDDTWPPEPRSAAQAAEVQELFEAVEPAAPSIISDEAVELQPDTSAASSAQAPPLVETEKPGAPGMEISDELIDRIAQKVIAKLSERYVSDVVWQVVPDLAEKMIRRELEKLHAGED